MKLSFSVSVLLIIISSLLLGLTSGCKSEEFALEIVGDKETIGANVFVNSKIVGVMTKYTEIGSRFVGWFSKGTLTVEVKKDGYIPFREVITVSPDERKYYLSVTFDPQIKGQK